MIDGKSPARAGLFFFSAGKAFMLVPIIALMAGCSACGSHPDGGEISIVSYNAMALFDGTDDGLEYSGYRIARGEWSPELYRERLSNLKTTILACAPKGPDIACIVELENEKVLSDLRSQLAASGYAYSGFAGGDTSTGCAILSRLPITGLKSHRPALSGQATPFRPILEARIEADGLNLFVFVNHWKSKSEGVAETEARRIASADLLSRLMGERMATSPDAICVACGDMNEEPDEWSRAGGAFPTALGTLAAEGDGCDPPEGCPILLADRPRDGGTFQASIYPGGRPDRTALVLVSPWVFPENKSEWSYWWKDGGEKIDHMFLSPDLFDAKSWEFEDFQVVKNDLLLDGDGHPLAWDTKARKGYSDHLPIRLKIKRRDS
jgi:endonuclease/exonuclease/phosphatase family metal-dependent hydrolase